MTDEAQDLVFYLCPPDPPPPEPGVTSGYFVIWSGEPGPAQIADAAMLHDGTGNVTIEIDPDGFRPTQVIDDTTPES